ncbi:uncharacterized protein [Lolium perenne]|uniref:uncharacterized protein isoform X2 n=1 Tax=Lolium perenne TaxID=4522 RepID=UPI0021F5D777|nr:uncharacterized protein LOC127301778 isoform X2 [Lolium perenne]
METVQERELLQLQLQGWPSFHAMPASFDAGSGYTYSGSSNSSVGGDGFLLGWEPPFGCFVAADAQLHDLFPLCMESLPVTPAATSTAHPTEASHGAAATPTGELGDFFLNFWDATGAYDEQPVAISSSCVDLQLEHEKGATATTNNNPFLYDDDDDDPLGSIFFPKRPTLPTVPVQQAPAEEPQLSSSSSSSHGDTGPHASDVGGAPTQDVSTNSGPSGAPAPPPCSSSLKRATPEASESTEAECSQSGGGGGKRHKATPTTRVLCPFAVLKPDGLDGGATLADINARILMRPARPVRHPVGEFACAPRALAVDVPGISGRAVSGFARLHTPGRGTITIMRTRG